MNKPDLTAGHDIDGLVLVPRSAAGNEYLLHEFARIGDRDMSETEQLALLIGAEMRGLVVEYR